MFGLIVAGRLVQTDFQQIGETQFLINLPGADSINHIVVFMTGQTPFPDGLGGSVHFSWPSTEGPSWQLLGHISNEKPSAIFKIANLKSDPSTSSSMLFPTSQQYSHQPHHAQIGISVEPLAQLSQQTPAQGTTASGVDSFVAFSQKMLQNFMNYASSFALNQSQMTPNPSETYVPLSTLQKWYTNFERRMQQNPNFWKS